MAYLNTLVGSFLPREHKSGYKEVSVLRAERDVNCEDSQNDPEGRKQITWRGKLLKGLKFLKDCLKMKEFLAYIHLLTVYSYSFFGLEWLYTVKCEFFVVYGILSEKIQQQQKMPILPEYQ